MKSITVTLTAVLTLASCSASTQELNELRAKLQQLQSPKPTSVPTSSPTPTPTPMATPTSIPTPTPVPTPTPDFRPSLDRIARVGFTKTRSAGQIIAPVFFSETGETLVWDWSGDASLQYTIYDTTNNWDLSTGAAKFNRDKHSVLVEGDNDLTHDYLKTSETLAMSYTLTLPNGKTFTGRLQRFEDQAVTQIPSAAPSASTPPSAQPSSPVPTMTSAPQSTPTPTPSSTTTAAPTPTPTPRATPVPTPTPFGPVPAGYPVPTSGSKCRVKFTKATISTGVTLTYDWKSSTQFVESPGQAQPAVNKVYRQSFTDGVSTRPMLYLVLPSLSPGTYTGSYAQASNLDTEARIAYYWTSSVVDWSDADSSSKANVTVQGNQSGYLWGEFDGSLGKVSDAIWVAGRFTCGP